MKKFKKSLLLIPVAVLVVGLVATPALAREGESGSNSGTGSGSTTVPSAFLSPEVQQRIDRHRAELETEKSKVELRRESEQKSRSEAQEMLEKMRKDHKEHSTEERKKNCEERKNGLNQKLQNLGKNADKYQARVDKAFTNAIAYQKDKNVQVASWDVLVANAQTAQAKSLASIVALKALSVNIDCTQPNVSENIATFKAAAGTARADLKAYKMAVKDMLKALEAAREATETTGVNQ